MVVQAEITILFQIGLYLNLIYLIQQQIKWFHGFLLVDKQWGTIPQSTENPINIPLTFVQEGYAAIATEIADPDNLRIGLVAIRLFNKYQVLLNGLSIDKNKVITYGEKRWVYYVIIGK